MTRLCRIGIGAILLSLCAWATTAVYNPENGHYYEWVAAPDSTFSEAQLAASAMSFEGVSGHLATITTPGEQAFLTYELIGIDGTWIGLVQDPDQVEADANWKWITGEPLEYTHWLTNQPDDRDGNETYVRLGPLGYWRDELDAPPSGTITGYLVEYDTPLAAYYNPSNNRFYQVIESPGITWATAVTEAHNRSFGGSPGILCTVTTQPEHEFLQNTFGDLSKLWLGGIQAPSAIEPDGDWFWSSGEPWSFAPWAAGQPDNDLNNWFGQPENRLIGFDTVGSFADLAGETNDPGRVRGYIVEYNPSAVEASGHLELQDFQGDPSSVFTLYSLYNSNGDLVAHGPICIDSAGEFRLQTPGIDTYTLNLKAPHWLSVSLPLDATQGAVTGLQISLINGDVDGDNAVGVFDYIALSEAFDSVPGDFHWLENADLDGDLVVSIFDYVILSEHFDQQGS